MNNHNSHNQNGQNSCFEAFVQWDDGWLNISVMPIIDNEDCLHYLVMLPDQRKVVLRINESGQWDEIKGEQSPFIESLGEAIEYHYAICN